MKRGKKEKGKGKKKMGKRNDDRGRQKQKREISNIYLNWLKNVQKNGQSYPNRRIAAPLKIHEKLDVTHMSRKHKIQVKHIL